MIIRPPLSRDILNLGQYLLLLRRRHNHPKDALSDRPSERSLCFPVRNHMHFHAASTRALPIYRHFSWIAPERCDVLLHPLQGKLLVLKPNVMISEERVGGELRVRQEAERVKSVVDRHDNDVWGLIDPVLKRPVSGIAILVPWYSYIQ